MTKTKTVLDVLYDDIEDKIRKMGGDSKSWLKTPKDWELYKILADWYDDNNLPRHAEAIRLLLTKNKHPYYQPDDDDFTWFNLANLNKPWHVDKTIYRGLLGYVRESYLGYKEYSTNQQAVEAFITAWIKENK